MGIYIAQNKEIHLFHILEKTKIVVAPKYLSQNLAISQLSTRPQHYLCSEQATKDFRCHKQ